MNLYVAFYKMIPRKSVIIIFLFPMNISPLVNLSDGLGVCLGMCSLFMCAVLVIQMQSGKGHTLKSFSASL